MKSNLKGKNWKVITELEGEVIGYFRYKCSAIDFANRMRLSKHDKMRIEKIQKVKDEE